MLFGLIGARRKAGVGRAAAAMLMGAALGAACPEPVRAQEGAVPLYLEMSVNGAPTGLVAEFRRGPDGAMSSLRSELAQIGLDTGGLRPGLVALDGLAGVTYLYEKAAQQIALQVGPARLRPQAVAPARPRRTSPTGPWARC